jgi:hypothetical protein
MTGYPLALPCQPDPRAERARLAALLPTGVLHPDPRAVALRADTAAGAAKGPESGSCAVLAWAQSGLMRLTGHQDGPPLAPRAPVLARAAAVTTALAELAPGQPLRLSPARILADRAAWSGWRRRGTVSANGTCHLVRAADGWLAVSLSRPVDLRSLPAVLGRELAGDPWHELRQHAAPRPAADVAAAAQLVGIPAAALGSQLASQDATVRETPAAAASPAIRLSRLGEPGAAPRLVLDLSAMWAGPLCASILHRAGWDVLKAEDARRPDGARNGSAEFYASLHRGIPAVQLDFGSAAGRAELLRLAGLAGIIVESSRPRALRQLGLVAEDWLGAAPGRTWISVTGYGRDDPQDRVAFGDDAAVAGGLVARGADGGPVFCGDAIADPLTGLHAGLAGLAAQASGGGWLADVPMAGVCAGLAGPAGGPVVAHRVIRTREGWTVRHGDDGEPVILS